MYNVFWFSLLSLCLSPWKYKQYLEFSLIYISFCYMCLCINSVQYYFVYYALDLRHNMICSLYTFLIYFFIEYILIMIQYNWFSEVFLPQYFSTKTLNSVMNMTCIIHLVFENISHSYIHCIHLDFCIAPCATMLCFFLQPCLSCLSSF